MDIVYLIKVDPENDSEELRYSLRSLKNIPHQKVILVGEKPEWVTNVEFIPVAQTKTKHQSYARSYPGKIHRRPHVFGRGFCRQRRHASFL